MLCVYALSISNFSAASLTTTTFSYPAYKHKVCFDVLLILPAHSNVMPNDLIPIISALIGAVTGSIGGTFLSGSRKKHN
jgi:hypothetical protein